MDKFLEKILLYSLLISDFGRKSFTEIDLDITLKNKKENNIVSIIQQNEDIFNIIPLKRSTCPNCKSQSVDLDTGFCGICGKSFVNNKIAKYRIDIDITNLEEFTTKHIIDFFKKNRWILQKREHNLCLLKKDNNFIAILFSLDDTRLKDYFHLKGWLSETKNVCYIIFSKSQDTELTKFVSKTPLVHLELSSSVFQKGKIELLLSKIEYSIENIKQENKFEIYFEGKFKDEINLQRLRQELTPLLNNLDDLALHNNNLSNPSNGYKYQNSIIKLLNLTILPIKVLAKRNIQDVLIRIPPNYGEIGKQIRWIPLEIKSFTPNPKIGNYFDLSKYSSQFRKYIQGYFDIKVSSIAYVDIFVILAYDFLLDKDNKAVIEQIEIDFDRRIHISLLPQDSLIYLIEKQLVQKNPLIDFDNIIDLFRKIRYIDRDAIDNFYKKIDDDFIESGEETTFKKVQERVHRMGK